MQKCYIQWSNYFFKLKNKKIELTSAQANWSIEDLTSSMDVRKLHQHSNPIRFQHVEYVSVNRKIICYIQISHGKIETLNGLSLFVCCNVVSSDVCGW